jgi:hypothetical protein
LTSAENKSSGTRISRQRIEEIGDFALIVHCEASPGML